MKKKKHFFNVFLGSCARGRHLFTPPKTWCKINPREGMFLGESGFSFDNRLYKCVNILIDILYVFEVFFLIFVPQQHSYLMGKITHFSIKSFNFWQGKKQCSTIKYENFIIYYYMLLNVYQSNNSNSIFLKSFVF